MAANCHLCEHELNLTALQNNKQRRAAHVCAECVRASMAPEELQRRLHPHDYPDQEGGEPRVTT